MDHRLAVIFSVFLLSGCVSGERPSAAQKHTLAGTPRFPLADIETFFPKSKWTRFRDLEYERYVIMEAQVQADGTVKIGAITDSFPDASRVGTAKILAQRIELHAASIGSHLNQKAEVVVVFFKPVLEGNLVLLFARQVDEPNIGMTKRAIYLDTFVY